MRTRLTKWGNSYALRIPKRLIDEMQLAQSEIEISQDGKVITLRKTGDARLRELLKDINPQEETDWGTARGKETW